MYRPSQTPHLILSPAMGLWITPLYSNKFDRQQPLVVDSHFPCHRISVKTMRVVVFHCRTALLPFSHLFYTPHVFSQNQTRVKLNRVFFPRCLSQARSLDCDFAGWWVGTVGISLIHSCASLIRWRGIWLSWESHSYSRRLPVLGCVSALWHSEHWAEITLRQHHFWPSQSFVLIKQSDSPGQ